MRELVCSDVLEQRQHLGALIRQHWLPRRLSYPVCHSEAGGNLHRGDRTCRPDFFSQFDKDLWTRRYFSGFDSEIDQLATPYESGVDVGIHNRSVIHFNSLVFGSGSERDQVAKSAIEALVAMGHHGGHQFEMDTGKSAHGTWILVLLPGHIESIE